jgi:hypothetical protein
MKTRHLALIFVLGLLGLPLAPMAATPGNAETPAAGPALQFAKTPDYSKRLQALDPSIKTQLLGRWTNPVDRVIIEIASVDLTSGAIRGTEWAQTGPAAGDAHELVGWVSAAPVKEGFDNVLPVTFSTTLYEYGTLPSWAGFFRDGKIVTMHYLIWPNRTYSWDHVSSFQETWTRMP